MENELWLPPGVRDKVEEQERIRKKIQDQLAEAKAKMDILGQQIFPAMDEQKVWRGTQAEYDRLGYYDLATTYFITDRDTSGTGNSPGLQAILDYQRQLMAQRAKAEAAEDQKFRLKGF